MTKKPERVSANPKPVESIDFWRQRIYKTVAQGGMLHQVIYDNSYDVWNYLQSETAGLLRRHLWKDQPLPRQSVRVLDAGCGYGALLCCFQQANLPVRYTGVDISPDLIELAELRYCSGFADLWTGSFSVADLKALPFVNGGFDWCVARSVEGMILENVGREAWNAMFTEMRRVARRVMLLDYPEKVEDKMNVEIHKGS